MSETPRVIELTEAEWIGLDMATGPDDRSVWACNQCPHYAASLNDIVGHLKSAHKVTVRLLPLKQHSE